MAVKGNSDPWTLTALNKLDGTWETIPGDVLYSSSGSSEGNATGLPSAFDSASNEPLPMVQGSTEVIRARVQSGVALQVEFEKGGTLRCELSITDDSVTPSVPVNITTLPDIEYWLYVSPTLIYKFKRGAETGYKALIKVDDYNYTALLDADETILLKNGMLMHAFLVALTDTDAEAGRFINLVTQETGLKICSNPISNNSYAS